MEMCSGCLKGALANLDENRVCAVLKEVSSGRLKKKRARKARKETSGVTCTQLKKMCSACFKKLAAMFRQRRIWSTLACMLQNLHSERFGAAQRKRAAEVIVFE